MSTVKEDLMAIRRAHEGLDERLRFVEKKLEVLLWVFGIGATVMTALLVDILTKHIS